MTDAPPFGGGVHAPPWSDEITQLIDFVDLAPEPMAIMATDWTIVHTNERLCRMLARPLTTLVGRNAAELLAPADRRYAAARLREDLEIPMDGPVGDVEATIAVRGDGALVPISTSISRLHGRYEGLLLTIVRDVTTDLEVEQRASETARLYNMLAAANGAILRSRSRIEVFDELCRVATDVGDFQMAWVAVDGNGGPLVPLSASGPGLGSALELPSTMPSPIAEAAWARKRLVVVHDIERDPLTAVHREISMHAQTHSGCAIPIRCRGEVIGILSTYMDRVGAYDHRRLELLERLIDDVSFALEAIDDRARQLQLAFSDPLTGLPNRTLLFDRVEDAARTARADHQLAVLLVDLDGFKDVNDALGHDIGDQLLLSVADRLAAAVRPGDFVARLGGDEFAVLCVDVPGVELAVEVAEIIAGALEEPFELDGIQTFISCSIGITVRGSRTADVRALLREADAALYAAKASGRNRWEQFDEEMRRQAVERLELSNALRLAAEAGQLHLVWQPVVAIDERETSGRSGVSGRTRRRPVSLEALLRWRHPAYGDIGPDRFISLAEETGLILPIGEWVVRTALEQMAAWLATDPGTAPDVVTINLSARQLAQRDMVEMIATTLRSTGVPPGRVVFEITETAVLADPGSSFRTLERMRELGVRVAIDDFGTGYSSLAYLRDMPVDALKIDRSFISRLGSGGADDDIVRSVISLAHGFDLMVIGEGVETTEQRDALAAMGCDRGQGFLWSPPLADEAVSEWIRAYRAAR